MRTALGSMLLLAAAAAQDVQPSSSSPSSPQSPPSLAPLRFDGAWQPREVGDGVVLRQRRFEDLFGARQCLTVLTIEPRSPARFDVDAPERVARTSAIATANGA